jgi:hypothetical protein
MWSRLTMCVGVNTLFGDSTRDDRLDKSTVESIFFDNELQDLPNNIIMMMLEEVLEDVHKAFKEH